MAETIVNFVLGKLGDAVVQEALFLYGVRDKVERVQRDLTWIQSFLKDADTKRHKNERVKKWVNEVQDVGYLIQDALDKFLAEVGGGRPEGLHNVLKRIGKMPMKQIVKHKVGKEIDQIQKRLSEIKENKILYGIEGLEQTSSGSSMEQPIRPFVNPDIDEMEVVGFEVDRKAIVDQLIDRCNLRRAVISIVGTSGSGKTTLAKEVYKSAEVKRHFDISMWLTISQEYKLIDILIKILKEISGSEWQDEWLNEGEEYLNTEINKRIRKRKYAIVLDDVWPSNNVWNLLQAALPDANNGSRVLITTRFIQIAEEADKISDPYNIRPLNEEESKQLLLKKVFPNRYANECPNEVLPLATQFTKKYGGWPLPLVVIAGILSRKNPDYITWDEAMQKIDWHTDGRIFTSAISTSYEDFPATLKSCFMYFGVFPEDHQIKATTLYHLWIAEGLISQDGTKLLEDIAESYLEELVQRCMVQVSKRSCMGKIKYCHIHDLLWDLAIQKAKEDNFLTVVSKNDTKLSCSTCARRVAFHSDSDTMIEHACTKNLRSLINYGYVPNFKRFVTLRVLHLSRVPNAYLFGNCLKGLKALTALKYIGHEDNLRYPFYCKPSTVWLVKRSPLTYMKNLQIVRTWLCKSHGELSPSFWGNKHLRHIEFFCCRVCEATPEGPPSEADLQSLLTLKGVRARQDWVAKLPNFSNIRKLGIVIPEDVAWQPLINFLSNLNHLGSLYLEKRSGNPMEFFNCISTFRKHNHLHSFSLARGRWRRKEVDDCTMFPPHLVKLTLGYRTRFSINRKWFSFEEDPMPQLEKLPNLKVLKIYNSSMGAADGKHMVCSTGGFRRLQRLILQVYQLKEWTIEEGAMPMLNKLLLWCRDLEIVPDLQYLVNLQELTVDASNQVKSRLNGEDQWKIKHIPSEKYGEGCLFQFIYLFIIVGLLLIPFLFELVYFFFCYVLLQFISTII